ncbi:hypothetical protein PENTCL1PPCAC_24831, partial [Pristionchus entomophagus]
TCTSPIQSILRSRPLYKSLSPSSSPHSAPSLSSPPLLLSTPPLDGLAERSPHVCAMKVFHLIRRYLIPLLLFILHCANSGSPPNPDFTKCNIRNTGNLRCIVHRDCAGGATDDDDYIQAKASKITAGCTRYLLVRAKTLHEVEIEFRDDKFNKATGATVESGRGHAFKCVNNKASSITALKSYIKENSEMGYDGLFCQFKVADPSKNVIKILHEDMPEKIVGKSNGIEVSLTIGTVASFDQLFVECDWSEVTRSSNQDSSIDSAIEEKANLMHEQSKMTCSLFNWFKPQGQSDWEKILAPFTCNKGQIDMLLKQGWKKFDTTLGTTKCTRPRCSICTCPDGVCSDNDPTKPHFNVTDGESCSKITCKTKHMLIDTGSGLDVHPGNSLECSSESKWKGGIERKIEGAKCVEAISCNQLHPMRSDCDNVTMNREGKDVWNCTVAALKDDGTEVCGAVDRTMFVSTPGSSRFEFTKFKCNSTSGRWHGQAKGPAVDILKDSNVYCLTLVPPQPDVAPKKGGITGGTIIGIIVGVAAVVAVIVIIVIFCMRKRIKKKGNREEIKSVSVTGRLDKNSKKKKKGKGKSSSSKTSEISAPPPPPCPDSLNLPNEPEPLPPPSGPPSSGHAPVGPDTGKPDKPAELIDIKLESEKKNDVSSKKEDKDKPKDADATESARSDTGKTGTKDTTKKMKNKKITLDKNGRGLTDDDDYNIDEGAKPVNHVDKNKKPYKPPIDPRKKMINVTMTEDDEGHNVPKAKPSLF